MYKLSKFESEIYRLIEKDKKSYTEIAKMLQCNESRIPQAYKKACRKLQNSKLKEGEYK